MSRPYPILMRWILAFGLAGIALLTVAILTRPAQSEDRVWFLHSDELEPQSPDDDPVLDTDDTDTDTDTDSDSDSDTDIVDTDDDSDASDDSEVSASQGAGELGGFHCSASPTHPALLLTLVPIIILFRRRR
ncbi:MAG: hypothetical protein AB8H79_16480 [Myxococcota bacterium]